MPTVLRLPAVERRRTSLATSIRNTKKPHRKLVRGFHEPENEIRSIKGFDRAYVIEIISEKARDAVLAGPPYIYFR